MPPPACVLLTSLHDSEMFAELVTTCGVCTKLNEILLDNLCKNNSMKPLKLNVLTCRDTVHKHVYYFILITYCTECTVQLLYIINKNLQVLYIQINTECQSVNTNKYKCHVTHVFYLYILRRHSQRFCFLVLGRPSS